MEIKQSFSRNALACVRFVAGVLALVFAIKGWNASSEIAAYANYIIAHIWGVLYAGIIAWSYEGEACTFRFWSKNG